jgi:hypothetical protein
MRPRGAPPEGRVGCAPGRQDLPLLADGQVYLLRKGRDFDVEVGSLAIAASRWAHEHGYRLTTRSEFDERQEGRPKVVLYVRFERRGARRRPRIAG